MKVFPKANCDTQTQYASGTDSRSSFVNPFMNMRSSHAALTSSMNDSMSLLFPLTLQSTPASFDAVLSVPSSA